MTTIEEKVSMQLHHDVEQCLFHEANLLDDFNFGGWRKLLAPDLHYWIPARRSRYVREKRAEWVIDNDHYDDDMSSMDLRLKRLSKPMQSSLDPRPREVRSISNIEVGYGDSTQELRVDSVILFMRNRMLDQEEHIAARRQDIWRMMGDGKFELVKRKVLITQNSILMANMLSLL